MDPRRYTLMIPGPTDSPDYVLAAMAEKVRPHYESEWAGIYWQIVDGLRKVIGTTSDVFPINGSGTLSFEICMSSLLREGDPVLAVDNTDVGEEVGAAAERFGARVSRMRATRYQPVTRAQLEQALSGGPFALVTAVHHDTASGFLNPLDEIGAACRRHDVPFLVDCVSSLAGVPFEMDRHGVDFCCSSVQKCFDCPPGLAIVAVSARAWRRMEAAGDLHRGRYMDLKAWRQSAVERRDWHPNLVTAATNNLMALRASLERILAEGLEQRQARYERLGRMIRAGLRAMGLGTVVEDRYAPLLTKVAFPSGVDPAEARDFLRFKYNILVGAGFRIPHFGCGVTEDSITNVLVGIEDYLRSKGRDVPRGACLKGLEEFRR